MSTYNVLLLTMSILRPQKYPAGEEKKDLKGVLAKNYYSFAFDNPNF